MQARRLSFLFLATAATAALLLAPPPATPSAHADSSPLRLCGDSDNQPKPKQNFRITGAFDSNYGPVHLERSGDRIAGSYECCGGGVIRGVIRGDELRYTWSQPGASGRGRWQIADGGAQLIGTWGSGDSESDGGAWNLSRVQLQAAR
jgi:hypothetical protein